MPKSTEQGSKSKYKIERPEERIKKPYVKIGKDGAVEAELTIIGKSGTIETDYHITNNIKKKP